MSFGEWLSIIARSELGSDLDCSVIKARSELGSDLDCYELTSPHRPNIPTGGAGPASRTIWLCDQWVSPCILGLLSFAQRELCFVFQNGVTVKYIPFNPLSLHDAFKHNFTSLKTGLISLQLGVLERKFPWNWFTNTWQFSSIFKPHQIIFIHYKSRIAIAIRGL